MSSSTSMDRLRYRKTEHPSGGFSETWFVRAGDAVDFHNASGGPRGHGAGSGSSRWRRCSEDGCLGEAPGELRTCLQHCEPSARGEYLEYLKARGGFLSLRGQAVSQEIWDYVAGAGVFTAGTPFSFVSLAGSEVNAAIKLEGIQIQVGIDMHGATITRPMVIRDCELALSLSAQNAHFIRASINCYNSHFQADLRMSGSIVEATSHSFVECEFARDVLLDRTAGSISLERSVLRGALSAKLATAALMLRQAKIEGPISLSLAELAGLHGDGMTVKTAAHLGPFKCPAAHFQGTVFENRVTIDVDARHYSNFSGASFAQGGSLSVSNGTIDLTDVMLGGPLRVSGPADPATRPEVISIRNADAGRMTIAQVSMHRCPFSGAHGLDGLRLESGVRLPKAPRWFLSRVCIPDEFGWRASAFAWRRWGWTLEGVEVGASIPQPDPRKDKPRQIPKLEAAQVAVAYRELRRTYEARSDMSGAAAFYYGEMEMRRFSSTTPILERLLATIYWAASGYGLRPMRAVASWLVVVGAGALGMALGGFSDNLWTAARGFMFAARASLPGVATLEPQSLTWIGQGIEALLRVAGPAAIALIVLAVRARLMRKPGD